MDEEVLKLVDLPEMVRRAVATPELAPLFQESRLAVAQIVEEISPKLPDILSVASDSVSALQRVNADLVAASKERESQLQEIGVTPSLGSVALRGGRVISVAGVGILVLYFSIVNSRGLAFEIEALLATTILGASWAAVSWRRQLRAHTAASLKVLNDTRVSDITRQHETLLAQFRQIVYEKGIRPEVNGILSQVTTPSYETRLGAFTATGLAEIFVSAHEVETQAKRDLNDLLKLPGGSIGLAGPRGAGKTTVMTLVANRSAREGKSPCSVLCPAPVEYSGRDFLVTLFLLLCNWVLQDQQPRSRLEFSGEPRAEKPVPVWASSLVGFLARSATFLFTVGLSLVMSGLFAAYYLMPAPSSAPAAISPEAVTTQHGPQRAPDSESKPVSASEAPHSLPGRYLKSLGLQPVTLLEWGLLMIAAAWIMAYFRPAIAVHLDARWEIVRGGRLGGLIGLRRGLQLREEPRHPPGWRRDADSLADRARTYRDALRFQQSYTSGWSGALKLPFGIEGGVNDAQTMSRNQRSLPELVSEFREFLQRLAAEYGRVTICIDELDKLESDERAHLFLNEIKAIFGVPNVFYLVSVSENAVSAFERRGLPFRDVFDSSFDTIVHVNYLTLRESKDLLKRRTTRIPEPFLCLCHCMSGGLPRDLIRACRDVLDVSAEDEAVELLPLARRVIIRETRSKARGMSIAVSKLSVDGDQTRFLSTLTELLTQQLDEKSLLAGATTLLAGADVLRNEVANTSPVVDGPVREHLLHQSALAELQTEFGLYLAYVGTVLEVLAKFKGPDDWLVAEGEVVVKVGIRATLPLGPSIFDQLATTRQALAVSASVGRQRLVAFRSSQDLDTTGIVVPLPAQTIAAVPPR